MNDELAAIFDRIANGQFTDADIVSLRQFLESGDREVKAQFAKFNVNIGEGKDIHIGDRTYLEINEKALQALVDTLQKNKQPSIASLSRSVFQWRVLKIGLMMGGLICSLGGVILFTNQLFNPQPMALCSLPHTAIPVDWEIYRDEIEPIEIRYSKQWKKQEIKDIIQGTLVVLVPNQPELIYQANLEIGVENFASEPQNLDNYLQAISAEIARYTQDVNIEASCSINLANDLGYMAIYSGKEKGNKFKRMEVGIYQSKKAYHLTYTAREEEFMKYLPTMKTIIASFKIFNTSPQ